MIEVKNQNLFFFNYFFSCYQQTSPLGVLMYAVGYPKTKVLAQFVNSKAFFLSPWKTTPLRGSAQDTLLSVTLVCPRKNFNVRHMQRHADGKAMI